VNVEIVAVGTELLLGQLVNTNATEIAGRLAEAGLDHFRQTVVGDNLDRMVATLGEAVARSDAVIVTGGIGPTQDDITREAMCRVAGVEMAYSDEYAARLTEWWERRGRPMPSTNLRQAEYPEGAELIDNAKGTAPGLRMRIGDTWVFALPGVPAEMLPMLSESVLPFLCEHSEEGTLVSRVVRTWGESESRIAEILGDVFEATENPTVAFLASAGEIKIRLTAWAPSEHEAAVLLDPIQEEVRRRLGRLVFAVGGDPIEAIVLGMAGDRDWGVATAESATGGMVAARLTSVPGASDVFRGSIVAYSTEAKSALLGVPAALMTEHGVVSEATAIAMASGVCERLGTEVGVAVTGAAGPAPQEQRAGTMIIAVQTPEDAAARMLRMPGDRERVRTYTTTAALQMLRLAIAGDWWRG
jgi:nicotinamide-nucleotide amidase